MSHNDVAEHHASRRSQLACEVVLALVVLSSTPLTNANGGNGGRGSGVAPPGAGGATGSAGQAGTRSPGGGGPGGGGSGARGGAGAGGSTNGVIPGTGGSAGSAAGLAGANGGLGGKLAVTPGEMTQADADAVFDAGWDEPALQDAIAITARAAFMQRLVEGHGFTPKSREHAVKRAKERIEKGYANSSVAFRHST